MAKLTTECHIPLTTKPWNNIILHRFNISVKRILWQREHEKSVHISIGSSVSKNSDRKWRWSKVTQTDGMMGSIYTEEKPQCLLLTAACIDRATSTSTTGRHSRLSQLGYIPVCFGGNEWPSWGVVCVFSDPSSICVTINTMQVATKWIFCSPRRRFQKFSICWSCLTDPLSVNVPTVQYWLWNAILEHCQISQVLPRKTSLFPLPLVAMQLTHETKHLDLPPHICIEVLPLDTKTKQLPYQI